MEIREDGRTLHVVELGVPNSKASFGQSILKATEFVASQEDLIKTGHAGVGSGIKFQILSKVTILSSLKRFPHPLKFVSIV